MDLDSYTALVGANGAGKSSILFALNVFFREIDNAPTNMSELDKEDFHRLNINDPITITLTFDRLSDDAQATFANYYRQGELVVSARATYDQGTGRATVKQYGHRNVMPMFSDFFAASAAGAKVDELRTLYNEERDEFDLPPPGTKDGMSQTLRAYEEAHPELCELVPSEDQFYGFSKGSNRLTQYVQWVYVPAVKDATKEQTEAKNTALGKLLARTVRSRVNFADELDALRQTATVAYQQMLEGQQGALDDLSQSLQARLGEWAHPDARVRVAWQQDPRRSVQVEDPFAKIIAGEGDFDGELSRFGHGFQRSYLLALLQELAGGDDAAAPCLLLGIEEPELYQHPPQARHLANVLQSLSDGNAQVVVATHSPLFVTGKDFESVRMVRRVSQQQKSVIKRALVSEVAEAIANARGEPLPALPLATARLSQALQPVLNEMFFAPHLIFVEGVEDVAYITTTMILNNRWPEFRRLGCHIVPVGGKSELLHPLAIARLLSLPTFVLFDADGSATDVGKRNQHQHDNAGILRLIQGDHETPFPQQTVWANDHVVWPDNIGVVLRNEIGGQRWDQINAQASAQFGNPRNFGKNPMHIGAKLVLAHEAGQHFPSLDRLCNAILANAAA